MLNRVLQATALGCLLGLGLELQPWLTPVLQGDEAAALLRQRLADAAVLEQTGQKSAARAVYDSLLSYPAPAVQVLAHYKIGTLHLEEVAPLWHALGVLEYARVSTGVALAKEHLQAALRLQPDHWEARYNLEYAERITPPLREQEKARWHGNKSSVFATLPSVPGGAP